MSQSVVDYGGWALPGVTENYVLGKLSETMFWKAFGKLSVTMTLTVDSCSESFRKLCSGKLSETMTLTVDSCFWKAFGNYVLLVSCYAQSAAQSAYLEFGFQRV